MVAKDPGIAEGCSRWSNASEAVFNMFRANEWERLERSWQKQASVDRNIARVGKNEKSETREDAGESKEKNAHRSQTILSFSYPRTLASPC
jgi:hypothetical protein